MSCGTTVGESELQPISAPSLPKTAMEWLMIFGPGAIVASLTIGTGELIFSTRGGALFGYRILFVFLLISVFKWGLMYASARHMMFTGVHPYERMLELPGPRGWVPLMLFGMAVVCMPVWVSFHAGVLGNLTSWLTGTQGYFHGGIDYLWGAVILISLLLLSASGGYSAMEKIQTAIVFALVGCAAVTLIIYQPDWLQMLAGIFPQPLSYPSWLEAKYPEIAQQSIWIETTRYVGVIGGAGFDYLAYTSWLREKSWGMSSRPATSAELDDIAADPNHIQRKWIKAITVDSLISFGMVVAFSAVFVASGAIVLGPREMLPDEENLLNLQASLITQIHPWLLPLYVLGAFLAMTGTLYGTIEIACVVADEIMRSFVVNWTVSRKQQMRRGMIGWCATVVLLILSWLFVRQAFPMSAPAPIAETSSARVVVEKLQEGRSEKPAAMPPKNQPKILLNKLMTPVNLFTGVLFCGVICFLNVWMDYRWLPPRLRAPVWLTSLNIFAGSIFLLLGFKGYWDHRSGLMAVICLGCMAIGAMIVAAFLQKSVVPKSSVNV